MKKMLCISRIVSPVLSIEVGEVVYVEPMSNNRYMVYKLPCREILQFDEQSISKCFVEHVDMVANEVRVPLRKMSEDEQNTIIHTWIKSRASVLQYDVFRCCWVTSGRELCLDKCYRIKPTPLEVNWDVIDDLYNCVFMDGDGSIYLTDVPVISHDRDGYWVRKGKSVVPWPKTFKIKTEGKMWQYSVAVRP